MPPGPAPSRRSTTRAGTAAAAPRRPWDSCGTTAARAASGTGAARRSTGRPGGRPPAARGQPPRQRRSGPPVGGRGRCAPPAAGRARPARRQRRRDSRRPRLPRRRPASAGHPRARSDRGPGAAHSRSARWWLHSACGVPSPPAFARRRFQDLSSGKVRRAHISRPDPQLQVIPRGPGDVLADPGERGRWRGRCRERRAIGRGVSVTAPGLMVLAIILFMGGVRIGPDPGGAGTSS